MIAKLPDNTYQVGISRGNGYVRKYHSINAAKLYDWELLYLILWIKELISSNYCCSKEYR